MAIWDKVSKVIFLGGKRPPVNLNLLTEMLKALPADVLKELLKRVAK
jgi:hypothetical protein